jgi:hypothetical protein
MFNLTPEGTAVAHGLIASTLQDIARYAILFTPSWHMVTDEQVISPEVLKRLQTGAIQKPTRKAVPSGITG